MNNLIYSRWITSSVLAGVFCVSSVNEAVGTTPAVGAAEPPWGGKTFGGGCGTQPYPTVWDAIQPGCWATTQPGPADGWTAQPGPAGWGATHADPDGWGAGWGTTQPNPAGWCCCQAKPSCWNWNEIQKLYLIKKKL